MTKKSTACAKRITRKTAAKKNPVVRIRRGRNENAPFHGILPPVQNFTANKNMVVIPPSKIVMVEVDDVWINDEFQRELLQSGIDDLIKMYEGLSLQEACRLYHIGCGLTLSSLRADGKISKIDGQRRLALAKWIKDTYGVKEFFIHTELVEAENDMAEATLFNSRNHRKSLTDCQIFKGKLKAGDKVAVAIDGILGTHGISIKGVKKKGIYTPVNAVNAVNDAYAFDGIGNNLDNTLKVIKAAWLSSVLHKVRRQGVNASAIRAVSIFLANNRGVSLKNLVIKLSMYSMRAIEAQIPVNRANSGHTRYEEMAKVVEGIYNAPTRRKPQIIL